MHIHTEAWTYLHGCVECVCGRILCRNHSYNILTGDGQIKCSCNLIDCNFIITFFRVFWRHVQCMSGPRPRSSQYSPLYIYKRSQSARENPLRRDKNYIKPEKLVVSLV